MKVLLPFAFAAASFGLVSLFGATPAAAQHPGSQKQKTGNIVEVATQAGSFKTLLAAAKAAGLVEPLVGKGPLTVLAPTDEAFGKLGKDAIKNLLQPENRETLAGILKYHVISGKVGAMAALKAGSAATLAGQEVTFSLVGGRLTVNGSVNIISNDVDASNGVIHVIDQVLIPEPPQPEGRLVIGFFSEQPGQELADYLGVDRNGTLLVSEVTHGSEAEAAGLKPMDLIVSINGRPASTDIIGEEKERVGFGGQIQLQVLRRGSKVTIESKVGAEGE